MTTPPNTDALREAIEKELKLLVYLAAQSPQNSKYKNQARLIAQGNIASAIQQHDQARLTAILAKPELLAYDDELGKGLKWAVPVEAITAAFEAVV